MFGEGERRRGPEGVAMISGEEMARKTERTADTRMDTETTW